MIVKTVVLPAEYKSSGLIFLLIDCLDVVLAAEYKSSGLINWLLGRLCWQLKTSQMDYYAFKLIVKTVVLAAEYKSRGLKCLLSDC